jgi:hypothetical protein
MNRYVVGSRPRVVSGSYEQPGVLAGTHFGGCGFGPCGCAPSAAPTDERAKSPASTLTRSLRFCMVCYTSFPRKMYSSLALEVPDRT